MGVVLHPQPTPGRSICSSLSARLVDSDHSLKILTTYLVEEQHGLVAGQEAFLHHRLPVSHDSEKGSVTSEGRLYERGRLVTQHAGKWRQGVTIPLPHVGVV